MEAKEIHKAIREKFHIKRRHDASPHNAGQRYNRRNFAELLGELKYNKGAEIGVRTGKFTRVLLDRNPDLHMTCVDPWKGYVTGYNDERQQSIYEKCREILKPYENRVTFLRRFSMDALSEVEDESLDFVYIDGNHKFDFVAPDIIFWSRKVRKNGIVACHDYYQFTWSGVVEAVDAYTKCHHIHPWYVTKEYEPTAFWVKP